MCVCSFLFIWGKHLLFAKEKRTKEHITCWNAGKIGPPQKWSCSQKRTYTTPKLTVFVCKVSTWWTNTSPSHLEIGTLAVKSFTAHMHTSITAKKNTTRLPNPLILASEEKQQSMHVKWIEMVILLACNSHWEKNLLVLQKLTSLSQGFKINISNKTNERFSGERTWPLPNSTQGSQELHCYCLVRY
jgi:hypothetical protein